LRAIPLFRDLDYHDLEALSRVAREQLLPKGSLILAAGDPGDALHLIVTGLVKVFQTSEDGREKTLAILGPGDCLGEVALLDGGTRSASASTMAESRLLTLPRASFQEALHQQPGLAEQLLLVLAARLRKADQQVEQLAFQNARGRVVSALLALAEAHGVADPGGRRITLRLTHQDLADFAGTTRETSTRVLAELTDRGLVGFAGRQIQLCDVEGLRRLLDKV
jgi:CRP-like cAMP-binding protein